ncbi:hypothetical protein [Undibacterium oligocarboniphilum]|nr:hypothetical protein [Undibacterium oligocarboniphilum]
MLGLEKSMPSSAKDFLTLMVEPTVAEFAQSPHDLRRGLLAAIVLNHMADHLAQEGQPPTDRSTMNQRLDAVRNEMLEICPGFQFIQDIADAAKHAKLFVPKSPSKPVREVPTSDRVTTTLGLFHASFGEGGFAEAAEVFVTLNDGTTKPLLPAVKLVLETWRTKL